MEIRRCVESIRASSSAPLDLIVVVNGNRFDPAICDWLKAQSDIRYHYTPTPSAPNAVLEGRRLVTTAFFSALDDDDEYMPGATDHKLAALKAHPSADFVVTNALRRCGDVEEVLYDHLDTVENNSLASLFESNWLHNGNALFKTETVTTAFFENYRPYAEWTWLAFKMIQAGLRVTVLDEPGFRVHVTPGSLSQSDAYVDAYLPLFESMLALSPPRHIQRLIRTKMSAAWHLHSVRELEKRNRKAAALAHWKSLWLPGGLRYLPYTRHIVG